MAEKVKKDKTKEKPKEDPPQSEEQKSPPARKDLSREQLEGLRRKLQKKFH